MSPGPSPLLDLPGAVAGADPDAEIAAHYGSFNQEQRALVSGSGFVDLSNREVLRIAGPDRLTFLHSLTTQYFDGLQPGKLTKALILSPQGHVEHEFVGMDDGASFLAHTEPGAADALIGFLESMKFMMRVEINSVDLAVCWRPADGGTYDVFARDRLAEYARAAGPAAGRWAFDALRIARGEPRFGVDTDHRSIPNELGLIPEAVHLDKGCYRGQETVARIHTLGRPPRRLTMLHLDGSENRLPALGSEVFLGDRMVGRMGGSARHFELGPIGLALLKRNIPLDESLMVDGLAATQEVVVDPEVGLHVRPGL
ncbi:MAG TPA: folate-binding protein [Marmoricola sp.]|nr:folate-binding protein [Marmoricola sp.]HNJ79070.1 folate-binding protein [Marmoricola sp.]HNN47397.1 folate-binding protein [Marmoricola sp.]HNO39716.1 folate-binding protein [Marmoricola sp.]